MSPSFTASLAPVAPDVYAYVQPDGGWCLNNAGFVVRGGEVLVIDTAATERRAQLLRAAIAQVTAAIPRLVVNTHFHGDHTFGNFLFQPEATIIAHEGARVEAAAAGLGMCGLWPDVDWGNLRLALPELTYQERATVHLADLPVWLLHPGPAHTLSDTVVWIPDRSVLFVGDILMSGVTPFCLMGSIAGSLRTIEWLRTFKARFVVTGHGPVGGPELFDETVRYLRWVQELASAGVRRGLTPLKAARAADLGEFAALRDPERLVGNLHRAYAEHLGEPTGVVLDVAGIMREMADFRGGPLRCHA